MRKENRNVMANMGPAYENVMCSPFLDMWGVEAGVSATPITNHVPLRVINGNKPISFLYPIYDAGGSGHRATATEMLAVLPFCIYPARPIRTGRTPPR